MNWRDNFVWLLTVIVFALMQSTWLTVISINEVLPDIVLLLTVYFGLRDGEERAMITGLIGGLFQDVTSYSVLGHHVLCLAIVGYASGRMSKRLITDHPIVKAGVVFIAALFHGVLFQLIAYIQDPSRSLLFAFFTSVVPATFYTAVITPLVFLLLSLSFRRQFVVSRRHA